ncbi:hypothetical protein RQP46_002065 [Phenoliferia psychrophenolica]
MRAHVEVDPIVSLKCLCAGLKLQTSFASSCSLQLVAFAQDPFFYPTSPTTQSQMSTLFSQVISLHLSTPSRPLSAIGSAPYVEASHDAAVLNIETVFQLAKTAQVDVDFHLDYDLDTSTPALLWDVLRISKVEGNRWDVRGRTRRITLGHCTKLSVFTSAELDELVEELEEIPGEVHFVALPPSDLYMQGRATPYASRSRATFPALDLVQRGISCSVGVNNVGNGFTPQGDADPLALLPMLVAVWQSAQPAAIRSLLEMVTTSAGLAAGIDLWVPDSTFGTVGGTGIGPATFTVLDGCMDLRSAVLAPSYGRTTLLYTDILTGDEMVSDGFDIKEVDDVVYEVDCAMVTIRAGEVDIGANASAEEAAEELQEGDAQVNNVVHTFRLASTQFDKKSYLTYLKGYMKAIKAKLAETNPDRVPIFEKNAAAFAKKVIGSFGDYEFYTGESMNPDGMVALLNYREDGTTPYFIFWKDGVKGVKI